MKVATFFSELKRRNVYRVATALRNRRMAADADSDAGFSFLEIPNWAIRAGDNADCDWFSNCPYHRLGL
jgi:hypothetical protein